MPLQHGAWQLEANAPGYRCFPQDLQVRPGETITRDLLMRRIAGVPRARAVLDGIELGAPVLFRGVALDPSSNGVLLDVVAELKGLSRALEVVARVAPGDASGDEAEAVRMSEVRARAVIDFLVSKGVSASLLTPRGLGLAKAGQPLLELRAPVAKPRASLDLHRVGGRL
jgi:hypothetical protein